MPAVFISYRSHDSADIAAHIASELKNAIGKDRVFLASYDMAAGTPFPEILDARLAEAAVFIAVIGRAWLTDTDCKLLSANPGDFVRKEVAAAIAMDVPLIPVLVHGATMPTRNELPEDIAKLADFHGLRFTSDADHEVQLQRLITVTRKAIRGTQRVTARRRSGTTRLWIALTALLFLAIWRDTNIWAPYFGPGDLRSALHETAWVFYEPMGKYLDHKGNALYLVSARRIKEDIELIKQAGFTGVVTASSDGVMKEVPRIAKQYGLKVMMGIWNAGSHDEVYRAIRQQQYVDAYWIEADEVNATISRRALTNVLKRIRRRARHPAALSLAIDDYEEIDPNGTGDWLFPHATLTLRNRPENAPIINVDRDVDTFQKYISSMVELARPFEKEVVFNKVAYPYAGVKGASREQQSDFFCRLAARANDPQRSNRIKVSIIANGAFDAPWKQNKRFFPWDPFTGLISVRPLPPQNSAAGAAAIRCLAPSNE